jgi:outer membrane protein assembly factor BamB
MEPTSKISKNLNKSIILFFILLLTALASCDKDNGGEDPQPEPGDIIVINLESDDYAALGVPVVMPNDNFVMAFIMDVISEGVKIYCFNKSGEEVWNAELPENPANPVFHNGQVYFACRNYLYALDAANGSEKWKYPLTGNGMLATKNSHKLCIDAGGNIIISVDSYLVDLSTSVPARIVSLSASGSLNWEQIISTGDNYNDRFTELSAPLATPDGIYCVSHITTNDSYYAALKKYAVSDGRAVASVSYDEYHGCKLHCAKSNGDVFLSGNHDGNSETLFVALTSALTEKWRVSFGDNYVANTAVIDKDGNIFIGVEDGYFRKYSPNGTELFSVNHQKIFVRGETLIAKDGNIYKCLQGAEKIDPQTGLVSDISAGQGLFETSDMSMLSDGTIVYSGMGKIYMLPTSAGGISTGAQWPSFGNDAGNSSYKN